MTASSTEDDPAAFAPTADHGRDDRAARRAARRARLWLRAAAVAAWLPAIGVPFRGWLDFAAFYAGGHFAGTPSIYDARTVLVWQVQHGMQPVPFVYPASVALAYAPLSALPFWLAAALHLALMVAALVWAATIWADLIGLERRWAVLGALAWGPAAASAVSGQNATLILLLVVLTTRALVDGRGLLAGVLGGAALAKPQLGAAAAAGSLLRGGVAALVALGVAALVHLGAGAVAVGGDPWWPTAWLRAVSDYTREDFLANGWQASSLPSVGSRIGFAVGSSVPFVILTAVAIVVAAVGLRRIRRMTTPWAMAALSTAAVVVSPHAWVYDATLLLPALGLLAVQAARHGWPKATVRGFVIAFAIASTWAFGGVLGFTLMPIVVVAVALAIDRFAPLDGVRVTGSPAPAS